MLEIKHKAKNAEKYTLDTIYIGGGTPSLIDESYIEQILNTVQRHFSVDQNPEITIESNPESLTSKKLKHYLTSGINRFSIGCQSLNNATLKSIGRIHQRKEIIQAIKFMQQHKIKNFSLDFIMGLPFQSLSTFKNELKEILSFDPPHLSFYFLSPDTNRIDSFIKECPSEDEQIKIYEHLIKKLAKSGYRHYEVSNYAKPGYECRHNLRYWEQKEYIGVGVSAHSYFKDNIFYNTSNLEKYLAQPGKPIESFRLDKELALKDLFMLNLRTSAGIDLQKLDQKKKEELLKISTSLIETGHLKLVNNHLYSTEKGYLILECINRTLIF